MSHGFFLAHIGIAISVIGVAGMSAWSDHAKGRIAVGDMLSMGDYAFELVDAGTQRGPNYIATALTLSVNKQGSRKERMIVETRLFPVEGSSTSEGSLIVSPLRTLYATVGEGDAERGWVIDCLLYTSPSPRDATLSRMPSSA